MAQRDTHDSAPVAALTMLIAAMVLIVAAVGYVAIDQLFGAPDLREVRIERLHVPPLPPQLPEAPRLPGG